MSIWTQRQAGETEEAFAAFRRFLELGPGRSIAEAYRAHAEARGGPRSGAKGVPGNWKRWSSQHNWRGRAEAHDRALMEAEQRGKERVYEEAGKDWAARQQWLREQEFRVAEKMMRRSLTMLDDVPDPEAEPVRAGDIAKLAETASKLGRLASGLVTERTSALRLTKPIEEMTDEELAELAQGADAAPARH